MIQRIQTLWLFLAALVAALLFYFDFYKMSAAGLDISNNYVAIILTGLTILLSLYTIFMFKKRSLQLNLIWLNVLVNIGLLVWLFLSIGKAKDSLVPGTVTGHYWIGAFLPLVTIILLFIARAGVRKDEKLIKSLNRLR